MEEFDSSSSLKSTSITDSQNGSYGSNELTKFNNDEIHFCVKLKKFVLTKILKERGWKKVKFNDDWHFFWGNHNFCQRIFMNRKLQDNQILNHFINNQELIRKDLLAKNLNRYRKELEKRHHPLAKKVITEDGMRYQHLDILPDTFVMPAEYQLFREKFKKMSKSVWIVKPCAGEKGSGIFLVNKLSQMKHFAQQANNPLLNQLGEENFIVQRYIERPFLLSGKKFDIRLYVLVTSFLPLKAYLCKGGFCRVCAENYELNDESLKNLCIHLTNISIQKEAKKFHKSNRRPWSIENLGLHLNTEYGKGTAEKLVKEIKWIIIQSLIATIRVMSVDRHCFELYGFDILIDEKLKPWVIEVNACNRDRILKRRLLKNILELVLPPDGVPDVHWNKVPENEVLRNFERLIDEETMLDHYENWVIERLQSHEHVTNDRNTKAEVPENLSKVKPASILRYQQPNKAKEQIKSKSENQLNNKSNQLQNRKAKSTVKIVKNNENVTSSKPIAIWNRYQPAQYGKFNTYPKKLN